MLIEVNKVTVIKRRSSDGSIVRNPMSRELVTEELKVVNECIRLDEIKSVRTWNKSVEEEKSIKGDMTMIYLIGDKSKPAAQMKINEPYDSFKERCKVISLAD